MNKNHTGVAAVFSVSFAIAIAIIVAVHYLTPSPDGGVSPRHKGITPPDCRRQGFK